MGQNQPLNSWEHWEEITHSTIYLLPTKADTKRNIESFANLVENQFNCKIKILRSDNGGGNSTWKISFIPKESFTKLAVSKHPNKMGL
jgi:hypothetical protein